MKGFYLINKPVGMTSHDVIDRLREITGEKRIGHAGTLDPAASGLLIVAVGSEYTKRIKEFAGLDKVYVAEIELGKVSATYDSEGKITQTNFDGRQKVSGREIDQVLKKFQGTYQQTPPAYSAKKVRGKRAYELARKGKEVKLKSVKVTINDIQCHYYEYPILKIKVVVSAGTYIRSLAHDIGQKLGTGAYLKNLVRTKIGKYGLENAIDMDEVNSENELKKSQVK